MKILFFYVILLLCKNIISYNNLNEDNETDKILTFNDKFNHMFITNQATILYFGTELLYIIFHYGNNSFESGLNIDFNKNTQIINFFIFNKTYTFDGTNVSLNITALNQKKNYIIINISNSTYTLSLELRESNQNTTDYISETEKKIFYVTDLQNGIALQILRGENFFIEFFCYILIIFGCFLLLFGASHFLIGVIFHVTLFLFFFFNDIFEISLDIKISNLIYLYIFLCLIIGISMAIFLYTDIKNKYLFLKIFHGCSLGFSFYKIIILYYVLYGTSADIDKNNTIYFGVSIIFLFLGVLLHLFYPFKQYIFLPSSAVTGSYYFVKGIKYVIGGYYSENLALRYKITFEYVDGKGEIISTYLSMTIILIIFSIFYQIIHIKQKQEEMPTETITTENYEISRISDLSRTSNSIKPEEEKELIDKSIQNKTGEEDDDDINDQED